VKSYTIKNIGVLRYKKELKRDQKRKKKELRILERIFMSFVEILSKPMTQEETNGYF